MQQYEKHRSVEPSERRTALYLSFGKCGIMMRGMLYC